MPNNMGTHIIFGVISVNDNTCAPSIDSLRTTHGNNPYNKDIIIINIFIIIIKSFFIRYFNGLQ